MFGVNINITTNLTPQEEQAIVNDYTINKIRITELAKKHHHGQKIITKVLDKYEIPHGRGLLRTGQSNKACKRSFTEEEKALVYKLYTSGGSTQDCMKAVHCGQDPLRELLQELGIYKTHADVTKTLQQNQRKYWVNDEFFMVQSPNLAYLLGFLASDGYIGKDRNVIAISLSSVDREILEKFKDIVGGRPIDDYITSDGFPVSRWVFTSQQAKGELKKYNIVPQKTFALQPPTYLDRKYWIDYIRGYFDGDGSINYLAGNKALRWQVCSATKEILEWIVSYLYEEYSIPKVNIQCEIKNRQNPLYNIQYSTNATKKIYDVLYTPNTWFLKRKKDKFEEILKKK